MTKLEEMMQTLDGNFWTRLNELEEDLTDAGFDVLEANREYVVVGYEDEDEDVQAEIKLAGTEGAIVIESYEETYRD